MVLDDVFLFLHNNGYARTHSIFSTDFLGHSPRYYDYLRCSGAEPSLRSLVQLVLHLSDVANGSASTPSDKARARALAKRVMSAVVDHCRHT